MPILLSKNYDSRREYVESFLTECKAPLAIYIYPKNRKRTFKPPIVEGCLIYCFTYEDMGKTDQWLKINGLVSEKTALILDNPSRYPKITSQKVLMLERLEKMVTHKVIVDIVPFTLSIEYLYTPYSYLGREILGYAHYYAFRENYHEKDASGRIRMSHDLDLLAEKIAPETDIDYPFFLCEARETIQVEESEDELSQYRSLREELFSAESFSPRVVITKLADLVHSFESRSNTLVELVKSLSGRTVVYTNLSEYARKAKAALKAEGVKDVVVTSYQKGADGSFDNCIYLESPIVKSYFLLDAESKLSNTTKVFHIRGSTKVDRHLYETLQKEIEQIDQLTREINYAKRRKSESKAVPAKECVTGGARANQLDIFQLQDSGCQR